MDFGFFILIAIAWMVFSAIREAMQKLPKDPGAGHGPSPPRPPGQPRRERPRIELPESFADASPGLRDLLDALEAARRPVPVPRAPQPIVLQEPETPEFHEDTTSLEEIRAERAPQRVAREEVDLDLESIEVARRRREAAARREVPRTQADHAAFDARIRQEPADATAVAMPARPALSMRDAMIWREILNPPPALRDD